MTLKAVSSKPKKCAVRTCRKPFVPVRPFQIWCDADCAIVIANQRKEKKRLADEKAERKAHREAKERIKPLSYFIALADKAIQAYRREYELSIGSGCISCDKSQAEVQAEQGWMIGGAWDGGHLFGKGARPELRHVEINIWLQCKSCNGGSGNHARKDESIRETFVRNVIARIGQEAYDQLKADRTPRKPTREQLKATAAHYRALTRELQRRQSC